MWINKIALVKITGEVEHIGKLCVEYVAEKSFGSVSKERNFKKIKNKIKKKGKK